MASAPPPGGPPPAAPPPGGPYQQAPPPQGYYRPGGMQCPRCQSPNVEPVKFTWWGGVLGAKMFAVTKCNQCRMQFNGKTGNDLTTTIILYNLVVLIIAGLVALGWILSRR